MHNTLKQCQEKCSKKERRKISGLEYLTRTTKGHLENGKVVEAGYFHAIKFESQLLSAVYCQRCTFTKYEVDTVREDS